MKGLKALASAKQTGVLVATSDMLAGSPELHNCWVDWCRLNGIPTLTAVKYATTASVTVSLGSVPSTCPFTQHTHHIVREALRVACDTGNHRPHKRPFARIHDYSMVFDGVRREKLAPFLCALVDAVYADVRLTKPSEPVAV